MQVEELQMFTVKGRVGGKVTYVIHVAAGNINKAWRIAQAYPHSQHLKVDWDMPKRVRSIAPDRVIIGEATDHQG